MRPFSANSEKHIYCFADNIEICSALLEGGAKIIQFREKEISDTAFRYLAKEMLSMTRSYDDAVLIINDRVDIAIDIDADGVHVGQEDENFYNAVRRVPGHMIFGVTAKTPEQAVEAERAGAAYVGSGAVFPSPTKPDSKVIGLDGLKKVVKTVKIPVVAIGGITIENIDRVVETGARYAAVISDINNSKNIPVTLNNFLKKLKEK